MTKGASPLFLVLILGTGPFGIGICLITMLVRRLTARHAISANEWIETFFAQQKTDECEQLVERISCGMETVSTMHCVEPFLDILSGGTVLEKQMAIAKITRYFRPQFAPLLLQAVQDPNAAVRVQAATALAKIERDFTMKLLTIEKKIKTAADPVIPELQVAHLCDDYAYAGLVDKNNRSELRKKAIGIYENTLSHNEDFELRLRLARLYMRQDQPQQTCNLLKDKVESGEITRSGLLWYMEGLYRLKQFAQAQLIGKRYAHALGKNEWEQAYAF